MKTIKLIILAILTLSAGILSSCNTTAGAGRDLQQAGEGVHDAARKVQSGY